MHTQSRQQCLRNHHNSRHSHAYYGYDGIIRYCSMRGCIKYNTGIVLYEACVIGRRLGGFITKQVLQLFKAAYSYIYIYTTIITISSDVSLDER
jgi:hypothetical protein